MNKTYMIQALKEAWKYQFLTYPNPAVGACIIYNNEILSIEAHREAGKMHAEVNALRSAYLKLNPNSELKNIYDSFEIHEFLIKNHNNCFNTCEIYVTLEPCNHIGKTPSCANLIKELKLKKVYIGSYDTNNIASGGLKTLNNNNINVEIGICKEKCDDLIYAFKLWQKNKFTFFKMAMRIDGSINGGYITSQDSLDLVHKIRTKLDLLVIGGNTVRTDRPKLDSRFAKVNKSSDILIYSKQGEFDKEIDLFKVENREVYISNNINYQDVKFKMVEGGYTLLNHLKNDIDMLMIFISHKNKEVSSFNLDTLGYQKIHSYFINKYDEVVFFKKSFYDII